MGIDGAVDIAYRHEIESADDPEGRRQELIDRFEDRTDAVRAAARVGIDGVVQPEDTRDRIRRAFDRADADRDRDWPPKKRAINPI
ncbi:carboxyl transferase domain-containing protein [Salinadaptatus halalkaliphilus]|uniref:carboxyl transferase domain-containing protein n=1 Tax=Salinadaptatus halalkaliphilus TaxID=2419781 RepID=UPI001FE7FA96|nr:carboxyl transferase domain-containing protein [Salinadaptatus halalkaliphilus]